MVQQNYSNHKKLDPLFHYVLLPLMLVILIGSIAHTVMAVAAGEEIFTALLVLGLTAAAVIVSMKVRLYALMAQDRAIRAEEQLRHFVLTGKPMDPRLTVKQIVALRFAPDGELASLSSRAAQEQLTPDQIKQAVASWRADHYRL